MTDMAYQEHIAQSQHQRNDKLSHSNKLPNLSLQPVSDVRPQSKSYDDNGNAKSPQKSPVRGNSQWSDQRDQDTMPLTSPTLSLREFPLTNIDNPNDIAQELSNLQALRRLSMDVGNSIDPDMPPMSLATMPAAAPRGDDDENDPSRLLWVPARVHPELAPTEFKTFLASRLQSIRRRSGDSFLSVSDEKYGGGSDSMGSSSLRRKKSMLSRQLDNLEDRTFEGSADGTDKSEKHDFMDSQQDRELSLDELVKDPSKAVQRLAQESHSYSGSLETGMDDMPILPAAPSSGLRRSTRTTYRKGGTLRFGDKGSFSKRMAQRQQSGESSEAPFISTEDIPREHPLVRVQSESSHENFSRPTRPDRRHERYSEDRDVVSADIDNSPASTRHSEFSARGSSAQLNSSANGIPAQDRPAASQDNRHPEKFPQRSSSQIIPATTESGLESTSETMEEFSQGSLGYHTPLGHTGSVSNNNPPGPAKPSIPTIIQTSSAGANSAPSSISNGNTTHTETPNATPAPSKDDKKSDKKSRKDKDKDKDKDEDSHNSTRSGGAWKWFKGVADDRDKKKEESRKSRHKSLSEKAQDNVRLDVIQTSIEKNTTKGRESLVLDRENTDNKVSDEKRKESNRKSDSKKEKDGSLFSSIFGGGKKREEKEKNKKYQQLLHVPEDMVPYKPLQPDIDYNWSRFPLLEERAIYRMAHIKLANPRRSLHSQVLLSNFMYSYLAIVQAMHPQMNVPISPQQKRLEEEARRKREEQEHLAQRDAQDEQDEHQSLDHYDFDYHRMAVQYADANSDRQVEYVDDAQIYEDDHTSNNQESYGDDDDAGGYSQEMKDYYQNHIDASDRHSGQDGIW
ncbi:hypothetical protein TGAM01_v207604 [Trichoderma gamsii]|uniref:Protein Zds1 C-terminal domain-containing protein n=1 Tax=Trichoderma gamsii TaxID=398673 RepID=A0A2P4ZHA3_9HYPO|nr:hypothetical protein TGAM01_v207604 [Trichoderma gamsii]PON23661.1 hypothetical protein TGAM01_v207604 [Trichoderma gamsii]